MALLIETKASVPTTESECTPGKRRPQQVHIVIPVVVKGKIGTLPFEETTSTASVNLHGCLVYLGARPSRGQQLLIVNSITKEERTCTVSFVGKKAGDGIEVGIECAESLSRFWHISFPPED
jgi:hypothetical protein